MNEAMEGEMERFATRGKSVPVPRNLGRLTTWKVGVLDYRPNRRAAANR